MKLGVDSGGTFTDFVWIDSHGRWHIHKQLSTPADPSEAILAGVAALGVPEQTAVVHGSTVATNALLERRGARTALVTTQGFADVLAIGRQNRPHLYALVPQKPAPLVPHDRRLEVAERISAQGEVIRPLTVDALATLQQTLVQLQVESVAVCLLFSFLRPEHEQQIRQMIQQTPELAHCFVSLSSDILPEYREYERTSSTVINAYVAPLMSRYLARLATRVQPRPLAIMQSNGGIINAELAGQQAARTALSGPAGGVVGAAFVAGVAGFTDLITFDMGGTSSDVALCHGRVPTTTQGQIADMPLRLPIIDIHTVGAGGGSLAYVDVGGALHVGPHSAGANPGPACYGQTAVEAPLGRATVTDANLLLGRLDADHFLGGQMRLDVAAARQALADLGQQMGVDAEKAAWDVVRVANVNMERAIRRVSIEQGHDPRLFTLVPFGGAGPLHACELAQQLQIPRVFIPPLAGVLSALGMLVATPTKDYSQTVMQPLDQRPLASWLAAQFAPLQARAQQEMAADGYTDVQLQYQLDVRYQGQAHELTLPLAWPTSNEAVAQQFHQAHQRRYGYAQPDETVELVTIRLTAVAPQAVPTVPSAAPPTTAVATAVVGEKLVWFEGGFLPTRLYDRANLKAGHQFRGPAIVFQYDSTIVVPPGWQTAVDSWGNLILTYSPDAM